MAEEEELQGVIIGDTPNYYFCPESSEQPKALYPLCNKPMIEYAIEFLVKNKVSEILIFTCGWHDQFTDYFKGYSRTNVEIKLIHSANCSSTGDVLLKLSDLNIIRSDFVLLQADFISNADISQAISLYRSLVKEDPNYIMLRVMKQLPMNSGLRAAEDHAVMVTNDDRILDYKKLERRFEINTDIISFKKVPKMNIRTDLLALDLDICSIALLQHVKEDSFGLHEIRDHIINGIFASPDIYTAQFAFYKLKPHEYAARVKNPRIYDIVSRDIIERWLFPIVPDGNFLPPASKYTFTKYNKYRDIDVQITRPVTMLNNIILGTRTKIDENMRIDESVIGENVIIGKNVVITSSYIWDGCLLEDNITLTNAILCFDVKIERNCYISNGTVVGHGATIAAGTTTEPNTHYALLEDGTTGIKQEVEATKSVGGSIDVAHFEEGETSSSSGSELEKESDHEQPDSLTSSRQDSELTLSEQVAQFVGQGLSVAEIDTQISTVRFVRNLGPRDILKAIIEPVMTQNKLEDYFELIQIYVNNEQDEEFLVNEIERIAIQEPSVASGFASSLFSLYQNEVIDIDAILDWDEETSNTELKNQCAPLVEQLNSLLD